MVAIEEQKDSEKKWKTGKYTLLYSVAWELPDLCAREEVQHRLMALLHRKQLG
jgi:hypothetical protein